MMPSPSSMSPVSFCQCMCVSCTSIQSNGSKEVFDFSAAVPERIQMNANVIQQREVEVGEGCSLLVLNMPSPLQAGSGAAGDQDRKVVVIVKAGITHAAAVHVDRVIEQRAVTVRSGLHFLEEP